VNNPSRSCAVENMINTTVITVIQDQDPNICLVYI